MTAFLLFVLHTAARARSNRTDAQNAASVERKRSIVEVLAAEEATLKNDFHGRITLSKCRVTQVPLFND